MKIRTVGIAALATVLATSAFAGGHSGNPAVKARQAHMELYQFNAGYLGGVARGKVEYNADAAQGAANNLLALVKMDQSRMWPMGTDDMSIDGTRAQPALWENFDKVIEISKGFSAAAENLALVAGNGADAVGGAIGPVFEACTACHKAFRAPAN